MTLKTIKRSIHPQSKQLSKKKWNRGFKGCALNIMPSWFFFFFDCTTQHVGPYFPDQISDPQPPHRKHSCCCCCCCCCLIQQGFINFFFFWHGHTCYIYYLAVLGLPCCTWTFSSCGERGLLSSCSAWASHCSDFLCCGAPALECAGFRGWGTQV